jgi:hypothetical protein
MAHFCRPHASKFFVRGSSFQVTFATALLGLMWMLGRFRSRWASLGPICVIWLTTYPAARTLSSLSNEILTEKKAVRYALESEKSSNPARNRCLFRCHAPGSCGRAHAVPVSTFVVRRCQRHSAALCHYGTRSIMVHLLPETRVPVANRGSEEIARYLAHSVPLYVRSPGLQAPLSIDSFNLIYHKPHLSKIPQRSSNRSDGRHQCPDPRAASHPGNQALE